MKGTNFHLEVLQKDQALVKPESETPNGLYFLSNLDQNIAVIVRTIYCFKSEERGNEEAVQVIKKALSQVLVHYYPLAGRLTISPEGNWLKTINDHVGFSLYLFELTQQYQSMSLMVVKIQVNSQWTVLKKELCLWKQKQTVKWMRSVTSRNRTLKLWGNLSTML